ncbi:hypothetical protein GJ496_004350 [Pomphorhynchus laevis]|nr:hypothetical protein GJ496_004350 [Pomphorhynchus laevis]
MQTFTSNNKKVYSLTNETYLPEWMSSREKRRLISKNPKLRERIELIQGLGMPDICSSMQITNDGKYLLALGTYKPRIRCYELFQSSIKFERGLDYEAIKVIAPEDDYSRLILLQTERYVEFHVGSGRHYRTRVPVESRDFALNTSNADIYFVGKSNEIHRLNIYQGQFMRPFTSTCDDLRCCSMNNDLQLLAVGTDLGSLQFWDCRERNMISQFQACSSGALTFLKYGPQMKIAAGDESGIVSLFDLRSKKPYAQRDHRYGLPINQIEFLSNYDYIASSDKKGVRVWTEYDDQKLVVAFEPSKTAVNGFCIPEKGTGLFFVPTESPNIHTFFIPSIGPAPKFCSFLDNLVEQLQETKEYKNSENVSAVYDNFKFLTRNEMDNLGISSFIGTPLTRPYMHGFLVQMDIYEKSVKKKNRHATLTDEEYGSDDNVELSEQLESDENEENSKSRIPRVNRKLFMQFKKKGTTSQIIQDERFTSLFEDKDYEASDDITNNDIHRKETDESSDDAMIDEDQDDFQLSSSDNESVQVKRNFELLPVNEANGKFINECKSETLASKLKRYVIIGNDDKQNFTDEIDKEKSFTFLPKSSKEKKSLSENKRQFLKRKRESNVRSAGHIIRDLDRPKRKMRT